MLYRNLGTSLKFFIISLFYKNLNFGRTEHVFCLHVRKAPKYSKFMSTWRWGKKTPTNKKPWFSYELKKEYQNKPNHWRPLPVNSCYFYMNHSFLIIHVVAQGYGEGGKAWFSLLEWLFFGVQRKQVNIALALRTLLMLCHCFQWRCQFIYWQRKASLLSAACTLSTSGLWVN